MTLFLASTFVGCVEDSIFIPKATTVNGITTVSGIRPGGLEKAVILCSAFVTHLVITDSIDSRDFVTMRDNMPNLTVVDLSNAKIVAYNGYEGTAGDRVYRYSANAIPEFAFYNPYKSVNNTKLSSIKFPQSIKSIRDFAFNRCVALSGLLEIPASVTDTIGNSAFSFCDHITDLTLAGTKYIGESAFQGCVGLSSPLVIPDSTITIKPWAFADCSNISSISISKTVADINSSSFNGCSALFSVDAASSTYSSLDGVLFDVGQATLIQFPANKSGNYVVPSTVGDIGAFAFDNCTGLTSITIPASVTTIEDYAFNSCSGLTGAFKISSGITSIGQYVFEDCTNIISFDIAPENTSFSFSDGVLIDLNQFLVKRCVTSKSGSYMVPADISYIDKSAFSNCTNLTSITFSEALSYIGARAFYNCTGLNSIYVKSKTPIDLGIGFTIFDGVNKKTCTLYVPTGTKDKYWSASIWNNFSKIVEN
ncbi:MAG: leucine-rich repeat domain-containing protein [Paludibacter sp.]